MWGTVQCSKVLHHQCVFGTPLIRQPLRAATFPRGGRLWPMRLTCYSKQSFMGHNGAFGNLDKKWLHFPFPFAIIPLQQIMQGSYIGNTTASQAVKAGSIPVPCSKKEVTFVYQKLLLFLSKPQAWHIISPNGAVYHPSLCDGISSRHSRA